MLIYILLAMPTSYYVLTAIHLFCCESQYAIKSEGIQFPVSVEAKLSFVKPGHRWAHSLSPSKASGISYQGTMKTSVRMLKTPRGL